MRITKRRPFTPGEILKEEFMDPYSLTTKDLARFLDTPENIIDRIIKGKGKINAYIAVKLSIVFGTSELFWLNLETKTDLWKALNDESVDYSHLRPIEESLDVSAVPAGVKND